MVSLTAGGEKTKHGRSNPLRSIARGRAVGDEMKFESQNDKLPFRTNATKNGPTLQQLREQQRRGKIREKIAAAFIKSAAAVCLVAVAGHYISQTVSSVRKYEAQKAEATKIITAALVQNRSLYVYPMNADGKLKPAVKLTHTDNLSDQIKIAAARVTNYAIVSNEARDGTGFCFSQSPSLTRAANKTCYVFNPVLGKS